MPRLNSHKMRNFSKSSQFLSLNVFPFPSQFFVCKNSRLVSFLEHIGMKTRRLLEARNLLRFINYIKFSPPDARSWIVKLSRRKFVLWCAWWLFLGDTQNENSWFSTLFSTSVCFCFSWVVRVQLLKKTPSKESSFGVPITSRTFMNDRGSCVIVKISRHCIVHRPEKSA